MRTNVPSSRDPMTGSAISGRDASGKQRSKSFKRERLARRFDVKATEAP
jgi:hypothetical protein